MPATRTGHKWKPGQYAKFSHTMAVKRTSKKIARDNLENWGKQIQRDAVTAALDHPEYIQYNGALYKRAYNIKEVK